jgi:hypothetical protein
VGGHRRTDAGTRDGHRDQEPPLARRAFVSRQRYCAPTCHTRQDRVALVRRRPRSCRYDTRPRVSRVGAEESNRHDDADEYYDDDFDYHHDDDNHDPSTRHSDSGVARTRHADVTAAQR